MSDATSGAMGWLDQLGGFVERAGATYTGIKTSLNPPKPDQTPTAPTSPIQTAVSSTVNQYIWLAAGAAVIIGVGAYLWRRK